MNELESDTSIVLIRAGNVRSTVILNHEDYLVKYMVHINNSPYQLLKKDLTTKFKNVGYPGWRTKKNKKKHWLKRPKAVPQKSKFGPKYK